MLQYTCLWSPLGFKACKTGKPSLHQDKNYLLQSKGLSGGSVVKNPPAKEDVRVQSLGQEDVLEKEMATRSSTLAWKIPWTEEPGGLQSAGSQRVGHD